MDVFKELIEISHNENRGLTIFFKGQALAGVVTQIMGDEALELRSQTYSRIIIRRDAIEAIAIN